MYLCIYDFKTMRTILFLILFLIRGISIAQQHESYSCNLKPIDCYENFKPKSFKNTTEYLKFVKHIHERLQNEEHDLANYTDALLQIAVDINYINKMDAYPYIYELSLSLPELEKINYESVAEVYKISANTAFYFRYYALAKRHLKKALSIKNVKPATKIDCLNTLGLIARTYQQQDSACYYFSRALEIAKNNNIKDWIGVVSGNLGFCLLKKGDLNQAKTLLEVDYNLSKEQGDIVSAYMAFLSLGEIELLNGERIKAEQRLFHILDTIQKNKILQNEILSIHLNRYQSIYYDKIGQYEKALFHFKESQRLREKDNLMRDQQDLEKMEFQIRFQKELREKEIEKSQRFLKNTLIATILFALTIVLAYLLLLLKKRKAERNWLLQEDQRKEEDLQEAKKYIDVIKSGIQDKNKIIDQLQEQMEVITSSSLAPEVTSITLQQIENLRNSVVLTEEDWIQFKRRFKKIHPTFISKLMKLNPNLTNAEIRLASLMKLDLNTTEISNTLGISADSVRKTNLRLRNKLEFKKQEELNQLIQRLS
jgi:DNA-binding CsgD family transcriptional regulator